MASDVMAVRLHLPQVRVLGVVEDTPSALVVEVESTVRRLRCPAWGFRCHRVHDRRRLPRSWSSSASALSERWQKVLERLGVLPAIDTEVAHIGRQNAAIIALGCSNHQ